VSAHPAPFSVGFDRLDEFDTIIDVRSPAEFAEDHIPGAINCPVLDDEERIRVGTLYKQVSPFEAKKVGAALVSRNIARHIETHFLSKPRGWKPLIYCWRGGQRSGAMTVVLGQIGWPARRLDGGYKAFRQRVLEELDTLPPALRFNILCGPTGSAKTALLDALAAAGAQVLDLEGLACHRGSVLGGAPNTSQPGQKAFETQLWSALRGFDPARPVWAESETGASGACMCPACSSSACGTASAPWCRRRWRRGWITCWSATPTSSPIRPPSTKNWRGWCPSTATSGSAAGRRWSRPAPGASWRKSW
jgi:tRNA 2-selenouridine synthase